MASIVSESSPVPGWFAGGRRRGVRHRRDTVDGTGPGGQRHGARRRRRAQRPGRGARRRVSRRCPTWRSLTWSIPTPGPSTSGSARSSRAAGTAPVDGAGHSPGARGQERRRGLDRHAQPLACPDDDLGLPGGQGRLRREAVQPQRPRGPDRRRGGPAAISGSSSTAPRAARARNGPWPRPRSSRASSASCSSPARCATSRAGRSASSRTPRPRRKSISTSGSARRPSSRSTPNLVHYNWHWFWDFGNGDIGNQGVHQMDIARWLIPGVDGRARPIPGACSAWAAGSATRPGPDAQHPDQRHGLRRHAADLRGPRPRRRRPITARRSATSPTSRKGRSSAASSTPRGATRRSRSPGWGSRRSPKRGPGKGHFGNFIAAVRSRKAEDLNADILEGHYSASLCHLANISYRLGAEVPFNKASEAFGDDKDAVETLARMEEHLTGTASPPMA